jgi:serine/threonine-protein kinase
VTQSFDEILHPTRALGADSAAATDPLERPAAPAPARPPAAPTPLAVPGFRLHEELGRGAQGIVFRAVPVDAAGATTGPDVAVKLLRPEATDDDVAAFERAAAAMDALADVPGVVHVLARGRTGLGAPWVAMELVRGPSLRAAMERGRVEPRQVLELLAEVASAVHAGHDRGVIHRDLKPENVLLDVGPGGALSARVADFGLARDAARASSSSLDGAGTLAYMAPEQLTGGEVTRRTDVHALGALVYEALTGAPPFKRASAAAIANAIVHDRPRPPATFWSDLPASVGAVALRALSKEPDARYPTAATFARQLRRALDGAPIDDVPVRVVQGPGPLARAWRAAAALVLVVRRRARFLRGLALGLALGLAAGFVAARAGWLPPSGALPAQGAAR